MRSIFVFGSNLAGKHYGGSAQAAVEQYGAIIGQGVGMQGDSYAIPTLDEDFRPLPVADIARHVANFLAFARRHKDMTFNVVAIGCGIAGFKPEQISPLFTGASENVRLPEQFTTITKGESA
jgi:hypothetical protein